MQVLIINLNRSVERLAQQRAQFNRLGMSFTRLPAVSLDDISEETYRQHAFSGQRPLKAVELACFFSHRKAWEWVLAQQEPCLILEDDAVLADDSKALLGELCQLENIDFINWESLSRKKTLSLQPVGTSLNGHYQRYRLWIDRNGAGAYLLFPSGAAKLLTYLQQRPIGLVDEFVNDCNSLHKQQLEPAPATQANHCHLFGITPPPEPQSIMLNTTNPFTIQLSPIEKIAFKIRRLRAQLKLGIRHLHHLPTSTKRAVHIDPSRFKSQSAL